MKRASGPDAIDFEEIRMNTDLTTEQAMPVPNGSPSIQGLVRADLEIREQIGRERYGTCLQPFNGRDGLRDAYEEVLDLAVYLRQVIEERNLTAARAAAMLAVLPIGDKDIAAWARRHGLGLSAGVGAVIGAVRADLRKAAGEDGHA